MSPLWGDLYLLSSETYKQYHDIQGGNKAQTLCAVFSMSTETAWLQVVEGKVEMVYKQVAVVEHFFNIIYR